MRRAAPSLLALGLLACGPSGTLVVASEGGALSSLDGTFTLVIPPGALIEDTSISLRALTEDEWPVEAPGQFELIGAVYQVEPAGLELAGDAYAVVLPPSPEALSGAEGDLLAVHYQYSPRVDEVSPVPASRTVHLADGRVAVVGTLYELGTHWVGDRMRGADRTLPQVHARIEAPAGEHGAGEGWSISQLSLTSDLAHTFFQRAVTTAVVSPEAAPGLAPEGEEGATVVRWDATRDGDLGLHPLEVFGVPGAREEARVTTLDREPASLEPGLALSPVVEPLPGWRCEAAGEEARLFVGVDVVTGASEGVVSVGLSREIGTARCR